MPGRSEPRHGFEFLGYKIKQGKKPLRLHASKIKSGGCGSPCEPALQGPARRKAPVSTQELIDEINPGGWGQYYCKVRKLFHQLDGWIVRRLHRRKRNAGWKQLPERKLSTGLFACDPFLEPSKRHLCESGLRERAV